MGLDARFIASFEGLAQAHQEHAAIYAETPSIRGHSAGSAPPGTKEYVCITEQMRAFLDSLGS